MLADFIHRSTSSMHWHFERSKVRLLVLRLQWQNLVSSRPLVQESGPVVSLTSYGKRVATVFLTIEAIGRGIVRPSRIVLWLDDFAQFEHLPRSLRRLQKRGLEVRLCENFGPHTKYYPYVEAEADFLEPLVTADDDVLYPVSWLSGLVESYKLNDQVINCYCARTVRFEGDAFAPYVSWPFCTSAQASHRHFVTGVSGVIYPPRFLKHLKSVGREFVKVCPKADDVWLHVNAIRCGFKVRQISSTHSGFEPIPGTQDMALYTQNMFGGGNDQQIAQTYRASDIRTLASEC